MALPATLAASSLTPVAVFGAGPHAAWSYIAPSHALRAGFGVSAGVGMRFGGKSSVLAVASVGFDMPLVQSHSFMSFPQVVSFEYGLGFRFKGPKLLTWQADALVQHSVLSDGLAKMGNEVFLGARLTLSLTVLEMDDGPSYMLALPITLAAGGGGARVSVGLCLSMAAGDHWDLMGRSDME